tara:strand:+ start:1841 stop:2248 length:408 start_codon:yes stop_codon:yes gene_type:complete
MTFFQTYKQCTLAHRAIGIGIPLLSAGLLVSGIINQSMFVTALALSIAVGLAILGYKLKCQFKDDRALTLLTLPYAELTEYHLKNREIFFDDITIEVYKKNAASNAIKLCISADRKSLTTNKKPQASYKKGTNKA